MRCQIILFASLLCIPLVLDAQIPTNGLVAYYPFNGNALDASGSGNDGTVNGATLATDRFGNPNSAYAFNTVTSEIRVTNSPSLSPTGAMTISLWVKFDSSWANHPVAIIGKSVVNVDGYFLDMNQDATYDGPGNYDSRWFFNTATGQADAFLQPVADATIRTWNHYVGVYSADTAKFYFNDILVSSSYSKGPLKQGSANLVIGGIGYSGYVTALRTIDDIRIYNRALSDTEIASLYHEAGWTSLNQGLVASYPFDGNSNDTSGNNLNGTITGGAGSQASLAASSRAGGRP